MATPTVHILTATPQDADACLAVLTVSFISDPAIRWIFPDPVQYLEHFPKFSRAFAGRAFTEGSAHYTGGFGATSLWLPPGVSPEEAEVLGVLEKAIPPSSQDQVAELLGQMGAFHPEEPHWYLPLVGTDPHQRGRGLGSALLRHMLAVCDAQQTHAYLEATSEQNVPLYERYGFVAVGKIQAGPSPTLVPMVRAPRPLP